MDTHGRATVVDLFGRSIPLSSLLDEIPSAVVILSRDRRVIRLNRAAEALTGIRSEDAWGLPCRHVLRSSLCAGSCPLRSLSPDTGPTCREGDIINRDRQKVPVRITFSLVCDHEGSPVGFLEVVEDLRILQQLSDKKAHAYSFGNIIGHSPEMERLFSILPGIAQTDSSVLITGETGTGKDLLAEAIHQVSGRAKGPFIKVNCGALPETLLESELFGHEKGAFTGAAHSKPGRFKLAHNGTLFLTEIGDLPLSLQVKLLTFLDDRIIHPLGSTKGIRVDVRMIAATHRDLHAMVREGRFREDLLFRLNVVRVHIPPLRERGDDVRLLLDHFLAFFSSEFQKKIKGFSPDVLDLLLHYPYPGNVRELKNIVEYAVNVCTADTIQRRDLPAYVVEAPRGVPAPAESVVPPRMASAPEALSPGRAVSAEESWEEVERRMILDALVQARGRRSRAAELLGWGRSTLWRKMKRYGIVGNQNRGE
jgi:transcriptional regulator with PAS, ATPase and Fis domain